MENKQATGRPTKLTAEVQDKIGEALRLGSYAEIAARYAGIHPATFYDWMKRGSEDLATGTKTIFSEFHETIKEAEALCEVRACGIISKAMGDSWQAAMTYLERKHPGRWSRNERRELSGTLQVVPINLAALTSEELEQAARLTANAQGIEPPEEIAEGSEDSGL